MRKKLFRLKKKVTGGVSVSLALILFFQTAFPTISYGLTSGPQMDEYASFEPAGTSDMVDLYTGDFNYNIPLLTVPGPNGGYPVNLSYHAGPTMDQEASWVGLGWTLNAGAMNRSMRGVPDDFNADRIKKEVSMRKYMMVSGSLPLGTKREFFGVPVGSTVSPFQYNLYYNNYKGIGYRVAYSLGFNLTKSGLVKTGVGLSYDSQSGIGIEPSIGLNIPGKPKIAFQYNSRSGVTGYGVKTSLFGFGGSFDQKVPSVTVPTNTYVQPFSIYGGSFSVGVFSSSFPMKGEFNYFESSFAGPKEYNAYGYNNTCNAGRGDMKDFIRSEVEYNKNLPYLSTSAITADNFTYYAQGASGSYRGYLAGVPVMNTPEVVNNISTISSLEGVEVGLGSGFHAGLNFTNYNSFSSSGPWRNSGSNEDVNNVDFLNGADNDDFDLSSPSSSGPDFEPVSFLSNGELNRFKYDNSQYEEWKTNVPVRASLTQEGSFFHSSYTAETSFLDPNGNSVSFSDDLKTQEEKVRRKTNFEQTTFGATNEYGRYLFYVPSNTTTPTVFDYSTSGSSYKRDNHIAQQSVLQSDGMRYNYDLPVYNLSSKTVIFSADDGSKDFNDVSKAVPTSGGDIDVNSTYYQYKDKTTLPPYVQSWLLTSVVSADYVDRTNNGPSDDDFGYWVKFTYKQYNDRNWRMPYNEADWIEGNPGDPTDDKALYTFGSRQNYYLQSIETKTHIATFFTSERKDALGAFSNEFNNNQATSGTITNSMKSYKLDKIELKTKDRSNGAYGTQLLKTVHFKYSYELCGNLPNNDGTAIDEDGGTSGTNINVNDGKLTLKKVYFTYENSTRGKWAPYTFEYKTGASGNPSYSKSSVDRWGHYMSTSNTNYPYTRLPYTPQEAPSGGTLPDPAPWSLTKITLPSGSSIDVEYETDSYSNVEDQKALRMFDVTGEETDHSLSNADRSSYHSISLGESQTKYKIYFKLEDPLSTSVYSQGAADDYIKKHYLNNGALEKLYFKTYSNIYTRNSVATWDWVEGFADISSSSGEYGACTSGGGVYDEGYVTVNCDPLVPLNISNLHPFVTAGINHLRLNRSEVIQGSPNINNTSPQAIISAFIQSVPNFINDVQQAAMGFKLWAHTKAAAHTIRLNGWTVIRLCDPDEKLGGGHRVKSLKFSNAAGFTETYKQTYEYKLVDGTCSGVAYEPINGDEESALTLPIEYSESFPLGGKNEHLLKTPMMKEYYPSQQVGYRRVVVKSDAPTRAVADNPANQLKKSAAPLTVYEFYSPFEFPIKFKATPISEEPAINRSLSIPFIFSTMKKKVARSQGYCLELNDMPGKLRKVSSFTRDVGNSSNPGEVGNLFSEVEYNYQTDQPFNGTGGNNRLNNLANVILSDGSYQTASLGVTEDVFIDMHENKYYHRSNSDALNVGFIPPFIPYIMYIPSDDKVETSLRTVVTNKIIYRKGLLKETVVTSDQSRVKTEIIAYDYETGSPVLTKANNEFEDALYNYSIPAHWKYPLMSGAYRNYDLTISGSFSVSSSGEVLINSGLPSGKSVNDYFTKGDKVYVTGTGGYETVLHLHDLDDASGKLYFIFNDNQGGMFTSAQCSTLTSIRVIESGYRNQTDYDAGAIVCKNFNVLKYDPADGLTGVTYKPSATSYSVNVSNQILNASAVEFTDRAAMHCNDACFIESGELYSPYRLKTQTVWKPYKSYSYITERNQNGSVTPTSPSLGNPVNVRTDGTFNQFDYFNWGGSNPNWTNTNTITKFGNDGFTYEQKDALGIYSASLYGYGITLNTAVAHNAAKNEIAFKSFEDERFFFPNELCTDYGEHWQSVDPIYLSSLEAHTGKKSLLLSPSSSYPLTNTVGHTNCDAYNDTWSKSGLGPYSAPTVPACACLGKFSPLADSVYVFSAWGKIRKASGYNDFVDYTNLTVTISFSNSGGPVSPSYTVTPSGDHVEGWQRYYKKFTIPAGATSMTVTFNNGSALNAFVDDVRIHPYEASMVTYVYDPVSYKLVATLDANNFSTRIAYDSQGSPVNLKYETSKALRTVAESRTFIKRQ